MSNHNDGSGFDPHSAPTIIEQAPIRAATRPLPVPPPPAKPKAVGDLLKEAFELYRNNLVLFLITGAIALGPVFLFRDGTVALLQGAMSVTTTASTSAMEGDAARLEVLSKQMQEKMAAGASEEELEPIMDEMGAIGARTLTASGGAVAAGFGALLLTLLLSIPLTVVAFYLAQAALVVAIADRARDGELGWQGSWKVVFRNLGGLLVTSFLAAAGTAVGLLMCVLPGLAFALLATFATPVTLLERRSGVDAIKRSFELVKADWIRVLVVLIVFAVVNAVAGFIGGLFVPDRFVFLNMLVGDLVSLVVLPFPIIGLVLLYNDIQRTKMGQSEADLAQRESELLAEPEFANV